MPIELEAYNEGFNMAREEIGNLEIYEEVSKLLEEKDRIIAELKAEKQTYISDMVDKGNEIYKLKDSCSEETLRRNGWVRIDKRLGMLPNIVEYIKSMGYVKLSEVKKVECINGEYQCEHVKEDVIDSNCPWCCLTVAEKSLKSVKKKLSEVDLTGVYALFHECQVAIMSAITDEDGLDGKEGKELLLKIEEYICKDNK